MECGKAVLIWPLCYNTCSPSDMRSFCESFNGKDQEVRSYCIPVCSWFCFFFHMCNDSIHGLSWLLVHSQTWQPFYSTGEDGKDIQSQTVCAFLWYTVWMLGLMLKLECACLQDPFFCSWSLLEVAGLWLQYICYSNDTWVPKFQVPVISHCRGKLDRKQSSLMNVLVANEHIQRYVL